MGGEDLIKGTILGLLGAGTLCLLGLGSLAGNSSSALGTILIVVGFVWGTILLFVLSFQLLEYGLTGILHDIGQNEEHDRWNRW